MSCGDCHSCGPAPVLPFPASRALPKAVALVGPPNSGKTTLFNRLTGMRQKVANYPGVTVEQHTGIAEMPDGRAIRIIDLPGIYSLQPRSEDEQIAHDVLTGSREDMDRPEAVLLVLDSTNLHRHLMLAAPILSLGIPTLVILNMADDLRNRGGHLDLVALQLQLGSPVALVSARNNQGIGQVWDFLAGAMPKPAPKELPILQDVPKCRQWAGQVGQQANYHPPAPPKWTRRLDAIFLHPVGGPLIFAAVVVLVFQTIFSYSKPLIDGVGWLFEASGDWMSGVVSPPLLRSLIEVVWVKGLGSVMQFLPQVLLLYFFIGLLEDSGYLARAALIADRTMARFGLQGKSFIPLLSAHACAVPAIMATRVIENKRDRLATILVAPFMTCSARLLPYSIIIAAFIPNRPILGNFFSADTAAMLGLYILGFAAAVVTARILKSSILKSSRTPFVLEMPSYRWPTLQSIGLRLLDRTKVFLFRVGSVILLTTAIVFLLCKVPTIDGHAPKIENSLVGTLGRTIEPAIKPLGFNWKVGIGLITAVAQRETLTSTMSSIYGLEESNKVGLREALRSDLTPASAFALLVFFALAMQCLSTLAVVRRETGTWKWPALQFAYMTALAYVGAFVTYHLAR
ncbi:MAG TPA: ferrous iron transporter B [Verrucomicrobiae bacterium]|nr:ferrous iron transporter B [Verrucomicrobiae bacterium]